MPVFHKEDKTGWQMRNRTLCHRLSLNLRLSFFLSLDRLLLRPTGKGKAAKIASLCQLTVDTVWNFGLFSRQCPFLWKPSLCRERGYCAYEGADGHSQQSDCTNGLNCRDPQAKFYPDPLWSKGIERITYIDGPMRHRLFCCSRHRPLEKRWFI